MKTALLVAGATGLVGREALRAAAEPQVSETGSSAPSSTRCRRCASCTMTS